MKAIVEGLPGVVALLKRYRWVLLGVAVLVVLVIVAPTSVVGR